MAIQTFIGADGEKDSIDNLCKTIDAGNRYGIPTMLEPADTMENIEFAFAIFDFGTKSGIVDWTPGPKTAPHILNKIPTTKTIHMAISPRYAAAASRTVIMPRIASIRINMRFLLQRSISTPAKGEINTPGSVEAAMSVPISAADPVTASTQKPNAIL